jgi:hydrogenase-4 component B
VIICLLILVVALPVFGCLPNLLMDPIAALGDSFANSHGMSEAVNYFSLGNLKGAGVSLAIGVMVYFLIVRGCLMKKNENGQRVYLNAWPKWLSIEDKIYRPGLLVVLPFCGAFVARIAGSLVDWFVAFYRKILFYKRPDRFIAPLDDNFGTYKGKTKEKAIKKGLSFSLLLFGVGVIFGLVYLITATCIVRFWS